MQLRILNEVNSGVSFQITLQLQIQINNNSFARMKPEQFLRIVEQICIILKVHQPSVHQVIYFYNIFQKSQTHQYRSEIIIAACIFLASKIDQNQHKIRDIVNVCYVITSLYKLINQRNKTEEGIDYFSIEFVKQQLGNKDSEIWKELIPDFPLDKFNQLKKQILQAQQHLLRILNFDIENSKMYNYKILVGFMDKFKLNRPLRQLAMKVYNDSIFTENPESPIMAVHFAIQLGLMSGIVQKQQVVSSLLDKMWWKSNTGVQEEEFLDYGIRMMEYYKNQ